jgi:hypothetical protein
MLPPARGARLPPVSGDRARAAVPAPLPRQLERHRPHRRGVRRAGSDLQLTAYGAGDWRATFYATAFGVSHAELRQSALGPDSERRLAPMLASRGVDMTRTIQVVVLACSESIILTQRADR